MILQPAARIRSRVPAAKVAASAAGGRAAGPAGPVRLSAEVRRGAEERRGSSGRGDGCLAFDLR